MSGQPLRQSPFEKLPPPKPDPDEPFFNFLVASAITGLTANEGTNEWSNDDFAENAIQIAECVQRRIQQRRAARPAL